MYNGIKANEYILVYLVTFITYTYLYIFMYVYYILLTSVYKYSIQLILWNQIMVKYL